MVRERSQVIVYKNKTTNLVSKQASTNKSKLNSRKFCGTRFLQLIAFKPFNVTHENCKCALPKFLEILL